ALENQEQQNKYLYTNLSRLLSKHEIQWELERSNFRDKLSDHTTERRKKYITGDISSYSQLKKKGLNDFEVYMKNYEHRYAKKKGLSKLDCYCEKKVFDNIQRLYGIGEKLRNEKKCFKKYFLKKYGIGFILIALIPALSFIFYILFGVPSWGRGIFTLCSDNAHMGKNTKGHLINPRGGCEKIWLYKYRKSIKYFGGSLIIFSIIMAIIVLIVIYAIFKVIKYERLKSGKDKICVNEYCRFAKDVFI
ncbi:Plasmodium exported protein, unknown function, partial [Plasmodium vivax]